MNFLQILFKGQRLIIWLVLVILYCFEGTCLIFFFFFNICEVSNSLIPFFEDQTKIVKGYTLSLYIYVMNDTKKMYLEIRFLQPIVEVRWFLRNLGWSEMIFCRICFHIIRLGKTFPYKIFQIFPFVTTL